MPLPPPSPLIDALLMRALVYARVAHLQRGCATAPELQLLAHDCWAAALALIEAGNKRPVP